MQTGSFSLLLSIDSIVGSCSHNQKLFLKSTKQVKVSFLSSNDCCEGKRGFGNFYLTHRVLHSFQYLSLKFSILQYVFVTND